MGENGRERSETLPTEAKMFRFSRGEMERRWSLVRRYLQDNNLEALLVQGYEDKVGGSFKWLTDSPAGYPRTAIVFPDDWMTVIESGANGQRRTLDGFDPDLPGVGEVISNWAFQTAFYTGALNAGDAVAVLRRRGCARIGVAGSSIMPYGFLQGVQDNLSGAAEIVDVSDAMDRWKAHKSDEELAQIRKTATTQDEVFAKVLTLIKPGFRDFEVNALIDYELQLRGAERGTYIGKSAPLGSPAPFGYRHYQGRTIAEGDHMTILLESNGLGGLWTELGRVVCFGRASAEVEDGFALCVEGQSFTAQRCVPGAAPADIARAYNDFMVARGGKREIRLYGHGMGYDMVERPLIREDETMALDIGCNLAIHPTHTTTTAMPHVCDNYVIDREGRGSFIHTTEKRIFEL